MEIKVLGPGCRNCVMLEDRTREALETLGLPAEVTKVTDPLAIAGYAVVSTPGLVVDGRVVVAGKVPSVRRLTDILAPLGREEDGEPGGD
jgi:small redox-active disulfide protein 2